MKSRFISALAIAGLMLTAACSGGGGSSSSGASVIPNPPPVSPGTQSVAKSSVSFRVPFATHTAGRVPSSLGRKAGVKPMYVSPYSNGGLTVIFDGQTVVNAFAVPLDSNGNPIAGSGPSGNATLPNGGTFSYTSTITVNSSGNGYVQLNANYTTIPGSHTIGVVQTDGPCVPDQYGRALCIPNTNGFVLAEGQTTFTLNSGANAPNTLFLRGVIQSAYLCDAACDGQAGTPDANGVYHLTAYAADESGQSIYQQADGSGNVVPFDNGPYMIAETDANNIVTLSGSLGPHNAPGSDNPHGPYGENFTIKCNSVGTTTVAMEFAPGAPSAGTVTGFNYTANNYPQPSLNPILSTVGADGYFGNTLALNCTATGSLIIE
ncbi:MAG: hypothetical protein ACXWNJ_09270 [Vulcanimicrobiaceae bacterium]